MLQMNGMQAFNQISRAFIYTVTDSQNTKKM